MYLRFLSFATLLAALVFVSFRWYQTSTALEGCRQDLQGAQRLLAFCIPSVEHNNREVFREVAGHMMAYRSPITDDILHRFQRLDTLHLISLENCAHAEIAALPKILSAYADSVQAYTNGDSLVVDLIKGVLKGYPVWAKGTDFMLRRQVELQLNLLQGLGFNNLAVRMALCGDLRFDNNYPILVPRQIEAKLGQPFEASLFLNNPTSEACYHVEYSINGKNCPLYFGTGNFKTTFWQPGVHQLSLKSTTTHAFTGEISVSSHTVEVLVRGE